MPAGRSAQASRNRLLRTPGLALRCGVTPAWGDAARKPGIRVATGDYSAADSFAEKLFGMNGLRGVPLTIAAAELFDLAGRFHDLLRAGEERMAGRTHFHANILAQCGAGNEYLATTAGDLDLVVLGMDSGLHNFRPDQMVERGGSIPEPRPRFKPPGLQRPSTASTARPACAAVLCFTAPPGAGADGGPRPGRAMRLEL